MSDRSPSPRRILVVRLSAIGDVVHGLPLARSLRHLHPEAEISWAVQREAAPLLVGHPWVDRIELFPRRKGLRKIGAFLARLGRRRYDLAVDLQGNLKSAAVAASSRAPVRLGLASADCREPLGSIVATRRAAPAEGPHSVDRTLALCRLLGDASPSPEYGLRATDDEFRRAKDDLAALPGPVAAVSVGSDADVREWADDGYVAVARDLEKRGVGVVVLSGPRHSERGRGIASRAGVACRAGDTDLRGLLAHLAVLSDRRGVLIACDSAPVHLAVAVGLEVVALSGPQDPGRTGPYGRAGSAISRWDGLPCAPCRKRTCALTEAPRSCMTRIEPAEVVRRALNALSC